MKDLLLWDYLVTSELKDNAIILEAVTRTRFLESSLTGKDPTKAIFSLSINTIK